jgi:hypothetical protein
MKDFKNYIMDENRFQQANKKPDKGILYRAFPP